MTLKKNVWADIAIRIVKELTKQFGVEINGQMYEIIKSNYV